MNNHWNSKRHHLKKEYKSTLLFIEPIPSYLAFFLPLLSVIKKRMQQQKLHLYPGSEIQWQLVKITCSHNDIVTSNKRLSRTIKPELKYGSLKSDITSQHSIVYRMSSLEKKRLLHLQWINNILLNISTFSRSLTYFSFFLFACSMLLPFFFLFPPFPPNLINILLEESREWRNWEAANDTMCCKFLLRHHLWLHNLISISRYVEIYNVKIEVMQREVISFPA